VHSLPQRVLASIHRAGLIYPGDRIGVAVSGGADSVALLRLLLELRDHVGIVLSVVHFNHHIRGAESDSDEAFVLELAGRYDVESHHAGEDVPSYAAAQHLSLEAAARFLRYRYFESLLRRGLVDRIATAHTLDDQAETVLLRLLRGAGTRGLAGIFPIVEVESDKPAGGSRGQIVRLLLQFRRVDLEDYLRTLRQPWRDDLSNLDLKHARNRVRQKLLPLLQSEFSPAVRERLGDLAAICRAEEEYWTETIRALLPDVTVKPSGVALAKMLSHPLALRRRLLRAAAHALGLSLEFEQVEEILRLMSSPSAGEKQLALGDEWCAVRAGDRLYFERRGEAHPSSEYEYQLAVPGQVWIPEIGSRFEATIVPRNAAGGCADQMLTTQLRQPLLIRNRRHGDRFFPAHSKSPKKLKELLQERHIPSSQRHLWPVIESASEIVWVRGFPCPAHLFAKEHDEQVLLIREHPGTV
jgi:tRNA(Ile)-lysidine synthase